MNWREFLQSYSDGSDALFSGAFIGRYGGQNWEPSDCDRKAAARLHTQLISRIATQRIGYLDGVEKTALESIYALFEKTRLICDEQVPCRHFETLAWHVLNTHVRPFTAKWHGQNQQGLLDALDASDEFRAELTRLQSILQRFEGLLVHLRDDRQSPPLTLSSDTRTNKIADEMQRPLTWGIPKKQNGGVVPDAVDAINAVERTAIEERRQHYGLPPTGEDCPCAAALALSGGGIRSATFSLGVLIALARRGLLPQFDYLSTVSGGGYLGSFLSAYLASPAESVREAGGIGIGLRSSELPFRREEGEAEALRHIRHHSKYLATGSISERLQMVGAQIYGMALNALGVASVVATLAALEYLVRQIPWFNPDWTMLTKYLGDANSLSLTLLGTLTGWGLISLVLLRCGPKGQKWADRGLLLLNGVLVAVGAGAGLGWCHLRVAEAFQNRSGGATSMSFQTLLLTALAAIPVLAAAVSGAMNRFFLRIKLVLNVLSAIVAPLFVFSIYLAIYWQIDGFQAVHAVSFWNISATAWLCTAIVALSSLFAWLLNINATSPHRHYRAKLASAYLIQPTATPPGSSPVHVSPFQEAVTLKLSELCPPLQQRGPYHLINCALNVPSSNNPVMQGRLTDFFLFSPAFCGSPLTGYRETQKWEAADSHLDLGTAMAISGAAAAPQTGLGTKRRLSFWLALLNVRLGYWLRVPGKRTWIPGTTPGLWFLLKEMLGWIDEKAAWLYLSDGGHIENLGVYELLRRRCKYIVAVDGEQDERMTFAALTTLQRLAAIDLGVKIDINLDDLRLNARGYSRSHFRFCRISYPDGGTGYLLYLKLSLTGNEGEFLRRYRLDEPAFPHHSTANQFFTETQFEAYRSLGEHVGDKLFLHALVGNMATSADIKIEDWFRELGKNLLEPLPQLS